MRRPRIDLVALGLFAVVVTAVLFAATDGPEERTLSISPAPVTTATTLAPTTTTSTTVPVPVPEPEPEVEAPRQQTYVAPQPTLNISGDCAAFLQYLPDSIIWRESRGDPNAVNQSSGALGCAQTLPQHYSQNGFGTGAPGTCADLDPGTQAGQLECVRRLSNGGSNLDPWR